MKKLILFLPGLLMLCGCGYTTGSLLPSDLQTINIQPFRNKINLTQELPVEQYRFRSYSPNLETDITKEVISRFITDGNLKVVGQDTADLVLTGELVDYLRHPVRYGGDNETVEEYRISIVCSVEVKDISKGAPLWQSPHVVGDSTYNISGTYASSEQGALNAAIADLARRIVDRTIEGW